MTATKLDPVRCRDIADTLLREAEYGRTPLPHLNRNAAAQLTASADLAERYERLDDRDAGRTEVIRWLSAERQLTEERVREVVREAMSAASLDGSYIETVSARVAKELAGAMPPSSVRACPCQHATPCHDRCTCVHPLSSSGCRRCCTYGSPEQQRSAAAHLAGAVVGLIPEEREAVQWLRNSVVGWVNTLRGRMAVEVLDRLLGATP